MTVESSWDGASREPLAAFAELSKIMLGDGSMNETLARIAALARETVPDTDEVSVTLVDHDKAKTVVFTGQLAMHLDERQYENGRGPCLDAALTGETVIVESSRTTACIQISLIRPGELGSPTPSRLAFPYRSEWSTHSTFTRPHRSPWPRRS
jgi:hypothetical protein